MERFDNPNGDFSAVKTYLNYYILRSCMDDDSNYSYSCMTSSSLIRVVSCIDMPDTPQTEQNGTVELWSKVCDGLALSGTQRYVLCNTA